MPRPSDATSLATPSAAFRAAFSRPHGSQAARCANTRAIMDAEARSRSVPFSMESNLPDVRHAGAEPVDVSRLPAPQRERWPHAVIWAQRAADRINTRTRPHMPAYSSQLNALIDKKATTRQKLRELRQFVDTFMTHNQDDAACRKGCSHCCHTPVSVSQTEAAYIGDALGLKPKTMTGWSRGMESGYRVPCPFLVNDACSIYAQRPIACRIHVNLDQDELLCRLIPEGPVSVPLMDVKPLQLAWLKIVGEEAISDIRAFFPKQTARAEAQARANLSRAA